MKSEIRTEAEDSDSREKLLLAARKLFARQGFDGTTVRDLAAEAGTNICMISYHFGGKDELYRACIERYGRSRLDSTKSLTEPCLSAEDFRLRLSVFIANLLESIAREPDTHRILAHELERGLPNARPVFEESILILITRLVDFFRDAQRNHVVRPDLDPYYLMSMIYSTVGHLNRCDTSLSHYFGHTLTDPRERETMTRQLTDILVGGSLVRSS